MTLQYRLLQLVCMILTMLAPLLSFGCGGSSEDATPTRQRQAGQPDVAFVVTPDPIVDSMLELAEVQASDTVYDLGCGDGRIVIAAAKKHGAKAVGIELDPKLVELARTNAKTSEVEHLVTIRQGDIFEEDFSDATVVMMYLLPELNVQLMPKLKQLREGSRIVSHNFPMKGARPEQVKSMIGRKLYLWRVPWKQD